MRQEYPIQFAKYARERDLLKNPVWKQLLRYVKNIKKMKHLLKYAKAKQCQNTVKIKFGMNITRGHKELKIFDADNGNTNWKDADLLKIKKIYNFDPFNSIGPATGARIPPGHANIQVNFIFEYKQDGRYKSQMVVSGKIMGHNLDTYYSSVISLRSMRTVIFG